MDLSSLLTFKTEIKKELDQILNWWTRHTVDQENGGFYGKINQENIPSAVAEKGLVLNARILYTFSAAFSINQKEGYLLTAKRAFDYLIEYFLDKENGGFYWSLTYDGYKLDGKKQVYGQAFVIYAFAEYYKASANPIALSIAKEIYFLLEKHSFDPIHLGYGEALNEKWESISDLRLSEKDQNEKKSMNTHLHVIEAYANLYAVWPNDPLKTAIKNILQNFEDHIINSKSHHLNLFFTEKWELRSTMVSFGHDIEAAWLLQEAAEIINDKEIIKRYKEIALQLTNAALKGTASNGGLHYEYDPAIKHWNREFHWWPQAEAMVGFYNAFQISNDQKFLNYTLSNWSFIKTHLKDDQNGEWFWGVAGLTPNTEHLTPMQNEDKAGFWKCPYHNGRACMELLKRID